MAIRVLSRRRVGDRREKSWLFESYPDVVGYLILGFAGPCRGSSSRDERSW